MSTTDPAGDARTPGPVGCPFYGIRLVLLTGANLLTPKQVACLEAVLAVDERTQVEVTWWIYQRVVAAYRVRGRARMQAVITSLSTGAPAALADFTTLARLWLTVVLDDYSQALAGYTLFLSAPSAEQTALAMHQAVHHKTNPAWPVCGLFVIEGVQPCPVSPSVSLLG